MFAVPVSKSRHILYRIGSDKQDYPFAFSIITQQKKRTVSSTYRDSVCGGKCTGFVLLTGAESAKIEKRLQMLQLCPHSIMRTL